MTTNDWTLAATTYTREADTLAFVIRRHLAPEAKAARQPLERPISDKSIGFHEGAAYVAMKQVRKVAAELRNARRLARQSADKALQLATASN